MEKMLRTTAWYKSLTPLIHCYSFKRMGWSFLRSVNLSFFSLVNRSLLRSFLVLVNVITKNAYHPNGYDGSSAIISQLRITFVAGVVSLLGNWS